jgi:preprotein translocase subunit SecE
MKFFREVAQELSKCSWPWNPSEHGLKRYKELIDSTIIVIASSALLAAFVTGSDFVLVRVIGFVIRMNV